MWVRKRVSRKDLHLECFHWKKFKDNCLRLFTMFFTCELGSLFTIMKYFPLFFSYDEQNAYLYGLIRRHDIQRKRKPVSERRTCSYKYYVRIKGKELQVNHDCTWFIQIILYYTCTCACTRMHARTQTCKHIFIRAYIHTYAYA